jgi:hypothetical protein
MLQPVRWIALTAGSFLIAFLSKPGWTLLLKASNRKPYPDALRSKLFKYSKPTFLEFGPRSIEATLFKRVAEAKEVLRKVPSPLAKSMLEGAEPVTVSLEGGKQGRALTLPYIGHGFALVPLAYAVTLKKDATIVVHAYLNPNAPRDLTKPIAALLQGIYKRLQQDGS